MRASGQGALSRFHVTRSASVASKRLEGCVLMWAQTDMLDKL